MECIKYLDEYERLVSYDPQIAELYADKLGWIKLRRESWLDTKIRVGIIGDTSCGKSTMINAILGLDILSSAVVPSSGVLVCCTYGHENAIIVHFKDGNKKIFIGDDACRDNLIYYSDERYNPNNQYNVASIELQTPTFELGNDVLLIDSPGLNAYGLEAHEKITLETLVPTIDYCVYVTTTKTTSDAHACEVLDTVARYKCPIMIIQNKLDAVREAPGGKKTKQQVAKEHYERIKRVVDYSSVPNKESVDIIQISAINALIWRTKNKKSTNCQITEKDYNESQFDLFLDTIKERLNELHPIIEQVRILNIYKSVREVSAETALKLESIDVPNLSFPKLDYGNKIIEIDEFISSNDSVKKVIVERIDESFRYQRNSVKDEMNEDNAKYYIANINHIVRMFENEIYNSIKESNRRMVQFCEYVHIPARDLYTVPVVSDYQKAKALFYEEKGKVKHKKAGVEGFFDRVGGLFSNDKDKGYEYVTETVQVIDVEATKRDILEYLNRESEHYKSVLSGWYLNCANVCEIIKNMLHTDREKALIRQTTEVEYKKLQGFSYVLYSLEKSLEQLVEIEKVFSASERKCKQDVEEIEVGNISSNILQLSSEIKKVQNNQVMKSLVNHEKLEGYIPILLGWDENCENHFDWNSGISDLKIIHLLEEEAPKEADGVDTCFFVLVNASQIGMEQKKVKNICLPKIVEPNDFVVWVVQDFEELCNSGGIEEGLRNMLWLRDFSGISSRSIVWINHDNPIFNISFLEQQYSPKVEIAEQQEYLDYLRNKYPIYCDEYSVGLIAKSIMKVRA